MLRETQRRGSFNGLIVAAYVIMLASTMKLTMFVQNWQTFATQRILYSCFNGSTCETSCKICNYDEYLLILNKCRPLGRQHNFQQAQQRINVALTRRFICIRNETRFKIRTFKRSYDFIQILALDIIQTINLLLDVERRPYRIFQILWEIRFHTLRTSTDQILTVGNLIRNYRTYTRYRFLSIYSNAIFTLIIPIVVTQSFTSILTL